MSYKAAELIFLGGEMIDFMELPFAEAAFAPTISEETIHLHYGKHHRGYVDKVNILVIGTEFQDANLEDIIRKTAGNPAYLTLYNNAGQVYNHNIYWQSFGIWNRLSEQTKNEILQQFGSAEELKNQLVEAVGRVFGSGWVWLVRQPNQKFEIVLTKNGDTPLVSNAEIIFNIDVWEHAYYLDYQNQRQKYAEGFVAQVLKI